MSFQHTAATPLRRLTLIALCGVMLAALTALAACDRADPSRSATPSNDSRKRIVTTFTILHDMAQNVAGDAAIVQSITKPGAEIHDYEPTPQDIVKAQDADLVLRNGLGLERWFEKFMTRLKDVPSADLSDGVTPINIGHGPYDGRPNPHAWMSPANALIYVENIRKALVQIDPENAETYNANAKAYSSRIAAIDQPLRQQLARIQHDKRWLVTSEGAFTYLARDYAMKELYLWPVNADQEGTPQQVKHVIDTIRQNHIPVCFTESTISDKPMKQVVRETGVKLGGVLYVDSLTDESGPASTYLKLLQYNADTILSGFGLPATSSSNPAD